MATLSRRDAFQKQIQLRLAGRSDRQVRVMERRAADWKRRLPKLLKGRFRFQAKLNDVTGVLESNAADVYGDVIRASLPALADLMETDVWAAMQRAAREWPVDTGLSLSNLGYAWIRPSGAEYGVEMYNRAPYAALIREPTKQRDSEAQQRKRQERQDAIRRNAERAGKLASIEEGQRKAARIRRNERRRGLYAARGPLIRPELIDKPAEKIAEDLHRNLPAKIGRAFDQMGD